jgi:hypothetical protein
MSTNDNILLRIEFAEDDSINKISIDKNSTIENLKYEIQKKLNINYDEQVLINKGEFLQNNKLLKDYNITNNNRIILLIEEKRNIPNLMNDNIDDSDNIIIYEGLNNKNKNNNIIRNNFIKNNHNKNNTIGNYNKKNIIEDEINTSSNNQIQNINQFNNIKTTKNKNNNNQLININEYDKEDSDEDNINDFKQSDDNLKKNSSFMSKFIEGFSDITNLTQNMMKNPEDLYTILKNPIYMNLYESNPEIKEILESPDTFKEFSKNKSYKKIENVVDTVANIFKLLKE